MASTGDICAYLNISRTTKSDVDHLADKFAVLDAQNNATGILHWLFGDILRQIEVAKCAFDTNLAYVTAYSAQVASPTGPVSQGLFAQVPPYVVIPGIFAIAAVLSNWSLVLATFKNLQSPKVCNLLIAFESLCQLPVMLPFLVNLGASLLRLSPIDHRLCLGVLMLSTSASFSSFLAIYFVSLERLLIILFPVHAHTMKLNTTKMLAIFAVVACLVFGAAMNLVTFNVWTIINLVYDNDKLLCNSGLYSDVLNLAASYVVLSMSLLNYLLILAVIFWRNQKGGAGLDEATRRILRSMLTISCIVLVGWLFAMSARNELTTAVMSAAKLIAGWLVSDPNEVRTVATNIWTYPISLVTCLPMICSAIGPPILAMSSREYGKAYRKTFSMFAKNTSTSIGPFFGHNAKVAANNPNNGVAKN